MNNKELIEHLNALIDGELDEAKQAEVQAMLGSCPVTRRTYKDLLAAKEVHQSKLKTPTLSFTAKDKILSSYDPLSSATHAPMTAEASISNPTWRERFQRRRTLIGSLAALFLLCGVIGYTLFIYQKDITLAHAQVVSHAAKELRNTIKVPNSTPNDEEIDTLAKILYKTGVHLDSLPKITEADFLQFAPTEINASPDGSKEKIKGVRLDYQDKKYVDQSCPRSVVSIFVFNAKEVLPPCPKKGKPLSEFTVGSISFSCYECPKTKGVNVFCFRDSNQVYTVATNCPLQDFEPRLKDHFVKKK